MKLLCVAGWHFAQLYLSVVASKLKNAVTAPDSKWAVAFGQLAPYAPGDVPKKAYEPLPNKTIFASADRMGFNNMRMSWEIAICYAYLTHRIYRIPELRFNDHSAIQHAEFTEWGLPWNMFAFYDERSFKMVIPSMEASDPLPSNDTLEPEQGLVFHSPENYTQSNLVFDSDKQSTRSFWQYAADKHLVPHDKYVRLIESSLRVRQDLIDRATKLLTDYDLEPGKYVALHRRRGDFDEGGYNAPDVRSNEAVARHLEPTLKGKIVLILTDTRDKDFEDKITSISHAARVVCWADRQRFHADLAFAPQIDMLAAVPAAAFVGTPMSTFTYGIMRWRVQAGTHKKGAPLLWLTPSPSVGVGDSGDWNSPGAPGTYLLRLENDRYDLELGRNLTLWFTNSK